MRLWIPRALRALLVCLALPAAASAQPAPTTPPPPASNLPPATPPAGPATAAPATAPAPAVIVMPNGAVYVDPYHIASPYNPTLVNQPVPNPALNRPITTLPCDIPNQNTDTYVPRKPECNHPWLHKKGCNCCGDAGCGCGSKAGSACAGSCSKGGTCTTCCTTSNFINGSSRSFFGESSREFFERPPSPDGIKMQPVKYSPPPAAAAYIPAAVVVP
jgi:hypothetical protein